MYIHFIHFVFCSQRYDICFGLEIIVIMSIYQQMEIRNYKKFTVPSHWITYHKFKFLTRYLLDFNISHHNPDIKDPFREFYQF